MDNSDGERVGNGDMPVCIVNTQLFIASNGIQLSLDLSSSQCVDGIGVSERGCGNAGNHVEDRTDEDGDPYMSGAVDADGDEYMSDV